MDKYLLIFNAGYNFTAEAKKLGAKLQLMSLPEVLQYEKEAKEHFLSKLSWKYDNNYENDVRQMFLKFKARVIGITQKDLEKIREKGIEIKTAGGTEAFILNPWAVRNPEVEKNFPPKKEEKKPAAATPAPQNSNPTAP